MWTSFWCEKILHDGSLGSAGAGVFVAIAGLSFCLFDLKMGGTGRDSHALQLRFPVSSSEILTKPAQKQSDCMDCFVGLLVNVVTCWLFVHVFDWGVIGAAVSLDVSSRAFWLYYSWRLFFYLDRVRYPSLFWPLGVHQTHLLLES